MTINGINYLLVEDMGCPFRSDDEINQVSDVGNYRVRVCFIDKKGVEVLGDLGRSYLRENGKITNRNALSQSLSWTDEKGFCWAYKYNGGKKGAYNHKNDIAHGFSYTTSDILKFVNKYSNEQYQAVKYVASFETIQPNTRNWTAWDLVLEFANKNHFKMESTHLGEHFIYTGLGKYKYCCIKKIKSTDQSDIYKVYLERA